MSTTSDPNNPRLRRIGPDGMQETYLVLSESEVAKGYVRPLRTSYQHVGIPGPQHELRDLTAEECERHHAFAYVKFEAYPESESPAVGRFWLDSAGRGCGTVTTMGLAIAETYARDPKFYGGTYCVGCRDHFPVGEHGEFVWDGTDQRVAVAEVAHQDPQLAKLRALVGEAIATARREAAKRSPS